MNMRRWQPSNFSHSTSLCISFRGHGRVIDGNLPYAIWKFLPESSSIAAIRVQKPRECDLDSKEFSNPLGRRLRMRSCISARLICSRLGLCWGIHHIYSLVIARLDLISPLKSKHVVHLSTEQQYPPRAFRAIHRNYTDGL